MGLPCKGNAVIAHGETMGKQKIQTDQPCKGCAKYCHVATFFAQPFQGWSGVGIACSGVPPQAVDALPFQGIYIEIPFC